MVIVMTLRHTTVGAKGVVREQGSSAPQDVLNCWCLGTYPAPMAYMAFSVVRCVEPVGAPSR